MQLRNRRKGAQGEVGEEGDQRAKNPSIPLPDTPERTVTPRKVAVHEEGTAGARLALPPAGAKAGHAQRLQVVAAHVHTVHARVATCTYA